MEKVRIKREQVAEVFSGVSDQYIDFATQSINNQIDVKLTLYFNCLVVDSFRVSQYPVEDYDRQTEAVVISDILGRRFYTVIKFLIDPSKLNRETTNEQGNG